MLAESPFPDIATFAGVAVTLATTLAIVVRWFMKKMDERDAQRAVELSSFLDLSRVATQNMTKAVERFEQFEAEEEQVHAAIMQSQQRLCDAQSQLHHELKDGNGRIVSKLDQVGGKLDVLIDLSRQQLKNGCNGGKT